MKLERFRTPDPEASVAELKMSPRYCDCRRGNGAELIAKETSAADWAHFQFRGHASGSGVLRFHFKIIDSTNQWAKDNCCRFEKEKVTLVTATEQTKGVGQRGRPFLSFPTGNVYATFCKFYSENSGNFGQIAKNLCLTAAQTIGKGVTFKEPNDLMHNGKKLGGVLGETKEEPTGVWLFLGIGINLNVSADTLKTIDQPATSLSLITKEVTDPEVFIQQLVEAIESNHVFS